VQTTELGGHYNIVSLKMNERPAEPLLRAQGDNEDDTSSFNWFYRIVRKELQFVILMSGSDRGKS
jgi:hypothetical protein